MKRIYVFGMLTSLALTAASTPSSADSVRIGLVLPDLSNEAISNINVGARERAKELGNVEILTTSSYSGEQQASGIENYVAQKVDAIIYDSIDAAAVGPAIIKANNAKIPVIAIYSAGASGKNATWMGPNFKSDGHMIGAWMANKLGKDGKVAVVEGNPADTAGVELVEGFEDGLKSGGIEKIVASAPTDWDRQRAFTVMGDMLTAHPDIQGVYGAIDEIALGALQAIKASGRKKDILLAGHNATCEGLAALLRSDLDYDIMTFPKVIGRTAVDLVIKLKAGQEIAPITSASVYGIDVATAQAALAGDTSKVPPEYVSDVKTRLKAASQGCK
jgi:ribose transport system substrate-binding protein